MIGGDKADELARLKGEMNAIEQSAIQKDCTAVSKQIARQREQAKKSQPQTVENENQTTRCRLNMMLS